MTALGEIPGWARDLVDPEEWQSADSDDDIPF
jgi:hypothetical protein